MRPHELGLLAAKTRTISDTFDRTAKNGFGKADSGQEWQALQNASSQYVDPARGASVTSAVSFAGAVVDVADTDVDLIVSFGALAGTDQGVILRAIDISNFWYLRVGTNVALFKRAGGVFAQQIAVPVPITAGQTLHVMLQGTRLLVTRGAETLLTADLDGDYAKSTLHGVVLADAGATVRRFRATPLNPVVARSRSIAFASRFQQADLSNYDVIFHRETISIVPDPLGSGKKVVKMSVPNTATGPTENVRAQMQPPPMLGADVEFWVGLAVMFPSGNGPTAGDVRFPSMPTEGNSGYFNICQLYTSNPESSAAIKLGFRIGGGDRLYWQRNETYGTDRPWAGELIQRDHWYEYAWHVFTSADETLGYAELWENKGAGWVQQTFFPGTPQETKRLHMKTLDPIATTNGPNRFDIQAYRRVNMWPFTVDNYFGPHAIGHSLAEVDPGMY